MPTRTTWITDAAYLMKAAGALGRFDYLQLKKAIEHANGDPIAEGYYLNSTPNPPTDAQDAFHTWLKTAPPKGPTMRVKLYKLKDLHLECPSCSTHFAKQVQKGVDVGVATLIVQLAAQNQYDRLILSAGDGDFEDAIKFAKEELHKEFWIAGFEGSVSADLQMYADNVVWLNEFWDKIKKV
jgi:hypothetical protein